MDIADAYAEYRALVYKFADYSSKWNGVKWNDFGVDSLTNKMWEVGCKIHNHNGPFSETKLEWWIECNEV